MDMERRRESRGVLVIRILFAAIVIQFAVWMFQLPRILDRIELMPRGQRDEQALRHALRIAQRLADMKLFVIRRNCLKKNLLYYWILYTFGADGFTIHVGVRKPGQVLSGHCWLTWNGVLYMDTEANVSQYTIMYSRGV